MKIPTPKSPAPGDPIPRRQFLRHTILGTALFFTNGALTLKGAATPTLFSFDPAKNIIPAPTDPALWPRFRQSLAEWRAATRRQLNYSDALYLPTEFAWASHNFCCCFLMLCDQAFCDPKTGRYRVRAFLDQGRREFGGYDSVVLWHAYPRIGLDARNQFDFYRDMPGGLPGLRAAVDDLHRQGVRAFIDYNPWDTGTRREPKPDLDALCDLVRDLAADGIFLDTMDKGAAEFRAKLDAVRPGVILEGEGALPLERIADHHASWAQQFDDSHTPGVLRNKWLERRHLQHQIRRWDFDHTAELHAAWMNGSGILVWENVFGSWVGWSHRDRSILRSMLPIQRHFAQPFCGESWTPLVPTLAPDVYASLWESSPPPEAPASTPANKFPYNASAETPSPPPIRGLAGRAGERIPATCSRIAPLEPLQRQRSEVPLSSGRGAGVRGNFSSRFVERRPSSNSPSPTHRLRLWTLVNRASREVSGQLLPITLQPGERLFDLISGAELHSPSARIPPRGIGCFLAAHSTALDRPILSLLKNQRRLSRRANFDTANPKPVTHLLPHKPSPIHKNIPDGMVAICPATAHLTIHMRNRECGFYDSNPPPGHNLWASYQFSVQSFERQIHLPRFAIDLTPVTNAQFAAFLNASQYSPKHKHNFLKHWTGNAPPPGLEHHPVVYVSLDDARAYARWARKRLPTEEEWQFAAQGPDHLTYPWGNEMLPNRCNSGQTGSTTPVTLFPAGRSPFGLFDMCGNVWHWTESERSDGRTRFCIIRGGSFYAAKTSGWYIDGGPRPANFAAKFLLLSPSLDRCATLGFRCAANLPRNNFLR
ncbi:MAG TPA: SUMF1/EgtB/PvdO family nonheme iron enzyme [Verrucomicrobiae bacterium]